jgi:membrane associated rhomboid family serine protease
VQAAPDESLPLPIYTWILILMIAVVFGAQYAFSSDPNFLAADQSSAVLAGFDKRAFLNGEYWRILTGATVHFGVLHVFMNCYALFMFGKLIELLSNRAHVAIVMVLSAIGGGVLSLMFNPDVISVGASGGIVGQIGYLAVYAFKRKQFISAEFRRSLLFNIGFLLLFGLVLYNVVDNFGHIGGLVTGALYGLVQIPSDEFVDPRQGSFLTKAAGSASLIVYGLACALTIMILLNSR